MENCFEKERLTTVRPCYVDKGTIVDRFGALHCEVFTIDESIPNIALKSFGTIVLRAFKRFKFRNIWLTVMNWNWLFIFMFYSVHILFLILI